VDARVVFEAGTPGLVATVWIPPRGQGRAAGVILRAACDGDAWGCSASTLDGHDRRYAVYLFTTDVKTAAEVEDLIAVRAGTSFAGRRG